MALASEIPPIANEEDLLLLGASESYIMTSSDGEACDFRAAMDYTDLTGSPSASVQAVNDLTRDDAIW